MNQFLKRSIHFFALPIFILIIAGACDKDMSVMLDNSATSNVGVSFLDSFTVNTSTVQLQNLPGTGAGSLLVGKASDARFGSVSSSSYFRIGFTDFTNDIPESAVFDSLNLVLRPNNARYYYGDTTKVQKINVHQLTQALETKSVTGGIQNTAIPLYVTGASIFKDQTFDYDATPMGTVSFNPRVRSMDSLSVRLSQTVGQNFFDLIRSNDIRVASNANFYDYFKGLVLVPDEANTVAIGFRDTLEVKINYSYMGTDGFRKTSSKVLSITDRNYKYNHTAYDREGTPFEALSATNTEVAANLTSGATFIQSGSGVVAKISFPTLKEFLQDDNISVNKAQLVIETAGSNNVAYPLPPSLILFVANHDNIPVTVVPTPYQSGIQQAGYTPGNQYGGNGSYIFDMIQYMRNVKSTSIYDDTSLYISSITPPVGSQIPLSVFDTFNTFNTAFIATQNGKPQIKLNILYTKFK